MILGLHEIMQMSFVVSFWGRPYPQGEKSRFREIFKKLEYPLFFSYIFKDFDISCVFSGPTQRSRGKLWNSTFFAFSDRVWDLAGPGGWIGSAQPLLKRYLRQSENRLPGIKIDQKSMKKLNSNCFPRLRWGGREITKSAEILENVLKTHSVLAFLNFPKT